MKKIQPSCCGGARASASETSEKILSASSRLNLADHWGSVRMRLGINRHKYRVIPGLYRLGSSGRNSPVFVTANYKLSFDTLRKNLAGMEAWILVLDTKGVNVWCAAGKGTFGTNELVQKIDATGLKKLVSKKTVIVPQLGAPGVAAHEVLKRTGFKVVFGPVRAGDIGKFMDNGLKADSEMRRVRFDLIDRFKLVFVEFAGVLKYLLFAAVLIFVISLALNSFSISAALAKGLTGMIGVLLALAAGTILTPLVLPWLPGRSFSLKGLVAGIATGLAFALLSGEGPFHIAAWALVSAAISSFLAMGFTGASTYTNLSGTIKEMTIYIPVQIASASAGIILMILPFFIKSLGG